MRFGFFVCFAKQPSGLSLNKPALGSFFLLHCLDVLAAVTIKDKNVRHSF
jgi:hypothetical protein